MCCFLPKVTEVVPFDHDFDDRALFSYTLDGKIVYANQAMSVQSGYHKEELLGLLVSKLFPYLKEEIELSQNGKTIKTVFIHPYTRISTIREISLQKTVIKGRAVWTHVMTPSIEDVKEPDLIRKQSLSNIPEGQSINDLNTLLS